MNTKKIQSLEFEEVKNQTAFAKMPPEQYNSAAAIWMIIKVKNKDQRISWDPFTEGGDGSGQTPNFLIM